MTDISKLKDLSHSERKSLKAQQIESVEQLWNKVGESPAQGKGIDDLAAASGIAPERLTASLVKEALRSERDWPLISSLGDVAQTTHPKRTCFLVLLVPIVTILVLLALAVLPGMLGARQKVVVAMHDLNADQVVRTTDLGFADLLWAADYFTTVEGLSGTVLAKSVSYGRPLRYRDVLRPQLFASSNITAGVVIARDAISVTWSAYQPGALSAPDELVGKTALVNIKMGELLLAELTAPTKVISGTFVVVSATNELQAFHIITEEDVTTAFVAQQAGAFPSPESVIGHMLLKDISNGDVLTKELISEVVLPTDVMSGRRNIAVPLKVSTFQGTLRPGDRVSVLLSPRNESTSLPSAQPGTPTIGSQTIEDVVLLALEQQGDELSALIAVRDDDVGEKKPGYQTLASLLAQSDLFLVWPSR